MKELFLNLVFGLLFLSTVFSEQDFSNVEIKTIHVAGTVYMLQGQGGNIGVSSGDDGVLIIDDQFEPLYDKIQNSIAKINEGKVRFLINTHWHGDHTGGNTKFGQFGTTIIAHENVRNRLSTPQFIALFNKKYDKRPEEAIPVITFKQSLSIFFNGEPIDVIHFPNGHTDGDSIIFFKKSNVIHMGDHFFNGFYPFIDLSSGGHVEGYINNIKNVIQGLPENVKIIPGHGPLAQKEDLVSFYNMLREATNIVKDATQDGQTLDEIKKNSLPKHLTEKWGNGFLNTEKWLEILFEHYMEDSRQ